MELGALFEQELGQSELSGYPSGLYAVAVGVELGIPADNECFLV
jgi:hypothetical protein